MCTFKSILPCLVAFTALVNCTVFVSCMDAVEVCGADNTSITLKKGEERPNIVFVLADDLGYGDLGCYGHPYAKTPCCQWYYGSLRCRTV